MKLEGSCHCGRVSFTLDSTTPYPCMRCWCSIRRKTAGGGGLASNIMGAHESMRVEGEDGIAVHQVEFDGEQSDCRRARGLSIT